MRWYTPLVLLAVVGAAQAGGDPLAGNWKVSFFSGDEQATLWILQIEGKDGKYTGKAITLKGVPPTKLDEIKVVGDMFVYSMEIRKGPQVNFEAKLPRAGAKKIFGTLKLGDKILPSVMESTAATSVYELNKEVVLRTPTDPRVFQAVVDLVKDAKKEKATPNEVKDWVETALKSAELYGPRLFEDFAFSLVESLEKDYPAQAVALAKKAETSLDPKASPDLRLRFMTMLASSLRKADQVEEAKAVEAKMEKLEVEAYAEYKKTALDFKIEKFEGRKSKSNRAVVVELFTGAQCPPCVAADLSFDAVEKAYPETDVVLLQYHLHIPGPDALTNPDSEARQKYYDDLIEGTPTLLLNGKAGPVVGGFRQHAEDRFLALRKEIAPLLEKPAPAQVQVTAARKGDKIDIKASVKDLEAPSEKVKLRLLLVEDWVRYKGRNGLSYHSRVVRDMPGGAAGFTLSKKDSDHTATVDLTDVRKRLTDYLDRFEKTETPFLDSQRPMHLRNLSVVAIVQNDATREVLQAADTPVKGGE